MRWIDGSEYKGEWVNGVQHGKGEMRFSDGTVKRGLFENNVYIDEIIEEEKEDESSMIMDAKPGRLEKDQFKKSRPRLASSDEEEISPQFG